MGPKQGVKNKVRKQKTQLFIKSYFGLFSIATFFHPSHTHTRYFSIIVTAPLKFKIYILEVPFPFLRLP
jgi:hypothetical protein